MSYLAFGARNISPRSFTFGRAFHRLPKPSFSWFARVTAWVTVFIASAQKLRSSFLSIWAIFTLSPSVMRRPDITDSIEPCSMSRGVNEPLISQDPDMIRSWNLQQGYPWKILTIDDATDWFTWLVCNLHTRNWFLGIKN